MPGTKAFVYTRYGILGDENHWYYTGTDADIDTQIANVKSTNGYLVDLTHVNYAEVISPIYLDGNGNPYGGVPTGIKFDQRSGSNTAYQTQRVWDPGQCAMNVLRLASAGKNLETITTGGDIYEINTQTGRDLGAHIPIDCIATAVKAQGTLTSDNTNVSDGDTATIGSKVYTFQTTLTNVDGNVKIGASADASLTNLAAAVNLSAGAGTLYATLMTANAAGVSSGAVIAHAIIVTAKAGGTAGNSIASTEASSHLSWDAATLGTTTAGVDPTATNVATAFVLAMNTSGTLGLTAEKISANEVVVALAPPGVSVMATTETLTGSNNAWDQTTLRGGKAAGLRRFSKQSRVPTAQEVTLTHMHFEFDFAPALAEIRIVVTATPGLNVAFDGSLAISGNRVTITDGGSVHLATSQTVHISVTD